MLGKQKSKLLMYRTVQNVCNDNNGIISANPAFMTAFSLFEDKIVAISAAAQLDARKTTGITIDKNNIRKSLCQKAADISDIISAYAVTVGDNTLLKDVEYTISTLMKMTGDTLPARCQNIHDAGEKHQSALTDYGLTKEMLTALQTDINAFTNALAKPRTAISERKAVTESLVDLFKETDQLLDTRMDKLTSVFKTAHPEFVRTYEAARRLVKPPTTHTKLKGTVTDRQTGDPINHAEIRVAPLDPDEENPPQSTKTDENGEYEFNPLIVDDYSIVATATGYQPSDPDDEFHATLGEVNHFDFELVK